ncbi:hypothetical protein ABIQ69_11605 [Agromyces sp. G08B096]|uniref:Uncharacterized protein n=1 Tax=Agromyces sp. G08B096 TaxID=3156399 RepID=A0AAU7W460_9MICO
MWIQFDGSRKIAVIRVVQMSSPPRPLLRAETWAPDPSDRDLIGFFPADELRLAAETVWGEYSATVQEQGQEPAAAKEHHGVPWHPLLEAEETQPGVWVHRDLKGRIAWQVQLFDDGTRVVYEGEVYGVVVGRFDQLRTAVEALHSEYVARFRA